MKTPRIALNAFLKRPEPGGSDPASGSDGYSSSVSASRLDLNSGVKSTSDSGLIPASHWVTKSSLTPASGLTANSGLTATASGLVPIADMAPAANSGLMTGCSLAALSAIPARLSREAVAQIWVMLCSASAAFLRASARLALRTSSTR